MRASFLAAIAVCALASLLPGCDNSLAAKCRHGDATACGMLGDRTLHDAAAAADRERACDFFRKGCAAENFAACSSLGALLGQNQCGGQRGEAWAALKRACDHGDMAGCNNLGMLFRDGVDGAPRDRERAIAVFRKACSHAAIACDNLGSLLIDSDERGATAAFQNGCAQKTADDAQAGCCYKLGLSYENGWGVPADAAKARALYADACSRSVQKSCNQLGLLELKGNASDLTLAASHFQRACELGLAGGCNNLGLMYADGKGVPANRTRALEYLERGCTGGDLRACANAGSRYWLGDGAPHDPVKGHALLAKACAGGVDEACTPPTLPMH